MEKSLTNCENNFNKNLYIEANQFEIISMAIECLEKGFTIKESVALIVSAYK